MAALPTQVVQYPVFAPNPSNAAAGGDTCAPGDRTWAIINNNSGASINVTVSSFPNTNEWGAALADLVQPVPAGAERWIGPLVARAHADPVTGLVSLSYSATTTVTVTIVAT